MAERVEFHGSGERTLVGRLDLPPGRPGSYAVLAHCFTCGKDSVAASRISRALTEQGFAVLRFDVPGLGEPPGDFADSSFSCDVSDLVAAADFLRSRDRSPALLVGHSLGGAAVLAAASRIPEVRAVATIGAPSDPAHVSRLLADAAPTLEADGETEVVLAGRSFRLRRAFLDDLREQPQRERIAGLGSALLVMHSPQDAIVGNRKRSHDLPDRPAPQVVRLPGRRRPPPDPAREAGPDPAPGAPHRRPGRRPAGGAGHHRRQVPRAPHAETLQAISANARNKVFFSCSPEDAKILARHTLPELAEHDLAHLDAYTAATRLLIGASTTPAFTLTTRPPAASPGRLAQVRAAVAARATTTTTSEG